MSEWIEDKANGLEVGDKIEAVIRHHNKQLNEPDQTITLTQGCDNFYIEDGPSELSYNWYIVKWRPHDPR